MDIEIEKEFLQNYIKREYQERILHELTKKREKALSRFSHNAIELLKKELPISLIKNEKDIESFRKLKNINEECYFISRFYDGTIMKLDNALKEAFHDSCASIIITKTFIIIKEEVEIGFSNIYFIHS